MEVKNKNIVLTVGVSRKVPDLAVALSFQFSGISESCLDKLRCNVSSHDVGKGSHEAAFAFALFEVIRGKLSSSPHEISKFRANNVSCSSIENALTITWNCQGTGSSLRKSCGIVLSCLSPSKLFSKYSENMRALSDKPGKKEHFNFCAKKAIEGINKGIQISAVGKVSIDDKKLKDIMEVIYKKLPDMGTVPAGENLKTEDKESFEYPIIKCKGITAVAVADYVRSNSGGMSVEVGNHGIKVFNDTWPTRKNNIKDMRMIKEYVARKYQKLEGEFHCLFAYFAITQRFANAGTVASILKSKFKLDKLAGDIKDALS